MIVSKHFPLPAVGQKNWSFCVETDTIGSIQNALDYTLLQQNKNAILYWNLKVISSVRAVGEEQTGRADIWIGGGAPPAVMTMRGPALASIGNPPVQFDSIPTLKWQDLNRARVPLLWD